MQRQTTTMELPATQAMDDELPPTQQFTNDEEINDSQVGILIIDKTSHPILRGTTSIGRHPQCKVWINDPTVSKHHAEIEAEAANRTVFIKDLESANRTKINETRLRPGSSYQIKDGDKLYFGSVVAEFKLFQAVEDSFISCTPQINRKVRSVIPGTPDSMNASSASEGDASVIPGTQNDVGSCFRRPESPSKTSANTDHTSPRVPTFSMDDFENSIYSAETQKSTENKSDDNAKCIYELETQRPSEEENKSIIEDLETQRCDLKQLSISNPARKSLNASIYSAETQKQLPEEDTNEAIDNIEHLETQQFDPKSFNNSTRKSHNLSIYNAETQKQLPEEDINNSLKKSVDVSIYSADTQKRLSEGNFNDSIKETSKLVNDSIYSVETQKAIPEDDALENLETQQFIIKPDSHINKSAEESIFCAETQKAVPDDSVDKSIENMETQQFTREPHVFQTPNIPKSKSIKTPLSEMETQKYDPNSSTVDNESLEDAETQKFEHEKSDTETRKSGVLISENKSETENLQEAETQKYVPDTCNKICNGDKSIDDLETQQFISNKPNIVINESTDNIETQKPADSVSVENMETIPCNEEIPPLKQTNENEEETNDKNIIDQPGTGHIEKEKSSTQNNISINNIDNSKSAELGDVEDEMFSQNLIEDCPFAFLPEESQGDIDQEMDTSKNFKELHQESNLSSKDDFSNLEVSSKSNISTDKNLAPSVDNDSETDEEGIFSNPTPKKNNTKTNIEKSNSDSETDEEGVFSSHISKESRNNEISDKNKDNENADTDEGVFSNPSKSCEKLNHESNETDSETDEEGIFSNSLSKSSEMNETRDAKTVLENDKTMSATGNNISKMNENQILDNSLKTANKTIEESNKSEAEPSKVQTLLVKQNDSIRHSPIPDSDDSLFDDDDDDEKRSNLCVSNLKVDKSLNLSNISVTSKDNQSTSREDVKKTDSMNNKSLNVNETLNVTKHKNDEVNDLTPAQVVDTSKSVIAESESEDEVLAPTQLLSPKKAPTPDKDKEADLLAPIQLLERAKSPVKKDSEQFDDLVLSPTQKIETQDCTEHLPSTGIVKICENNKIDRNASVEDLDYEISSTQPIEDKISKESMNSSKRQLEELEITCNKKLKSDAIGQSGDLDSSLEKNLNQLFDGAEEAKVINQGPELLTQQLENILESSQIEEDSSENTMVPVPSPTLSSSRKSSKAKRSRKVVHLKIGDTSSEEKKIGIDLNDTIERNLNDMFNTSTNDVEPYEPDGIMTQQLANILESQENTETNVEETTTKVLSNSSAKPSRSNKNTPSSSKSKPKRTSKTPVAQSRASTMIEEPKSKIVEESVAKPQGSNLKSKKKRASAILDSTSKGQEMSDDEKELVYKHGIIGFADGVGAIRTSEPVPLYEPKGRPFTSDSQSEGEDPDSSQRQKRFSLSLSKNVDLNSSLSDWDMEKTMTETTEGKEVKQKRVLAKGTRGFETIEPHAAVESEELVSALSTEGEEEISSSQKKVSNVGGVDRNARRRQPLAITRSKRTAAEDSQNQPPKRAKTQNNHVKLQELSNTSDQPKKAEKNLIKFPKPSESYVVLQRPKSNTDNSESLSKNSEKIVQQIASKSESEVKSTSRRVKSKANEATKAETSITKGLGKNSVLVEDSDAENVAQRSTRGTRSRRNKDTNSSVVKSSSQEESSGNSGEDINKSTKSTRGKSVRQNQKKAGPIKDETIIPDSDQESDESMSKSKEEKIVRQVNSDKEEEIKKSISKSTRSRRIKDSEKLEDSEPFVNTASRSRRVKNDTSKVTNSQDSISEKLEHSESFINTASRGRRVRKPTSKVINSQSSDSEKLEDSESFINTASRSKRARNATSKVINSQSSDSEKLEDSESFVNKANRSKRIKIAPSTTIVTPDSDSEFSKKTIDQKEIKSNKNAKKKKHSESEQSTSPEKGNKLEIPAENKKTRSTRRGKEQNSSNSALSESDNDKTTSSSVVNSSTSSRSARQTRKRPATDTISSESQEVEEFMASKVDRTASDTRSRRGTKKTDVTSSNSSQSQKGTDESPSDENSEKQTSKSKRGRVNKPAKNTRSSPSPAPSQTPSESLLTPSRSRRSSILLSPLRGSQHKVLFTGDKSEAHKNIVIKLGASVIDDPAKCTILVTDKVRRTCKFLCCVARGIPIVTFKWLDESLNAQHFVDWRDYILEDPVAEAQYKFNLQESLKKAREQKLLEGYTVFLSQIPATTLSTKDLKEIVSSSGGKPIFRAPTKWPEKVVIVTTTDKLQNVKKLIVKAPKSVTIHSTEFLFTGILRQEVNLQEFKLFS